MDILGLNEYGPEHNRDYRYKLVVNDYFSKLDWTVSLKKKKRSICSQLESSKRERSLLETDDGSEFVNNFFNNLLKNNNIERYSTNTSTGAPFAEILIRTNRDLLKDLFFEGQMLIGLIYYPQKQHSIIKEYILPPN